MLNPWYVTGFCEAGAAFTYSRSGKTFSLYFSIRQKEDNRHIIEDIYQYFYNIGNIYIGKSLGVNQDIDSKKSFIYYRVNKINHLKIIIQHFDKYPLQSPKKRDIYKIWRQMVLYKSEHYRDIEYEKLKEMAEQLSGLTLKNKELSRARNNG
jgi:hypothetical protein